ncbi:DUF5686 family protein [Bergeyella sp. RCAD1439]|uniref:DUF5686 family protein n=1 Tax=Bergeyella anatis TaxID=3113737 RepID=UPI002E17D612|nr:DUF5686 family protein [Bergeyella sp. RCAD1439]
MKKNFITGLLVFLTAFCSAQSFIKVYGAGDRRPLAGATIACNGKIVAKTDASGEAKFRTKCRQVEVRAKGYYEDDVLVDKVMEATLAKEDPKTASIAKIVLADKSDERALAILEKVNEHYAQNLPTSLPSYSYKSYEKISLDLDRDSIDYYDAFVTRRIDSLGKLPVKNQTEKKRKDSLETQKVMKLVAKSSLFIWEKAQEYKFSAKYGEKILVLDNKVSGLNDPVYEMMTIRSNRLTPPREIRPENRSLYRFFLTDTLEIDGRKNYVIRFRQVNYKTPVNRKKYNGYLYVDMQTYGLKKIESNSRVKNEGSLTSIWIPVEGKWFLHKESLKLKAGNMAFNQTAEGDKEAKTEGKRRFGYYIYRTTDYFDYQTPIEEKSSDFKGYTMRVENADGRLLEQYRTEPLTAREQFSYEKIDSLGQKYRLDTKAKFFTGLLKGKIRLGQVDLDAGQVFKYNAFEGFRLGAAFSMNERFHRYVSPRAYLAYGFKDGRLKYGLGLEAKTTLEKTSVFSADYYNDVVSAGRFREDLWNFRMKMMNSGVELKNNRFYGFEGFRLAYENDLSNALTMKVSLYRNREKAFFDYDYKGLGREFTVFAPVVTFKYSPNSKNIMTPSGKFTYEQSFPEVYFSYERGMKFWQGDFAYNKADLLVAHQVKTKLGQTGLRAYAGWLSGESPIWRHFQMNGLGAGDGRLNFNLTSYLGFATMEAGKYYSDKFAGFYLTHRIPWYFKSLGQNASSFDLVYRGIGGNMSRPESHRFTFSTLDHFYQEVGLEWNNFLSTKFNLGFFYRVGHYHTPNFKENFAIQLKLNFLGF